MGVSRSPYASESLFINTGFLHFYCNEKCSETRACRDVWWQRERDVQVFLDGVCRPDPFLSVTPQKLTALPCRRSKALSPQQTSPATAFPACPSTSRCCGSPPTPWWACVGSSCSSWSSCCSSHPAASTATRTMTWSTTSPPSCATGGNERPDPENWDLTQDQGQRALPRGRSQCLLSPFYVPYKTLLKTPPNTLHRDFYSFIF